MPAKKTNPPKTVPQMDEHQEANLKKAPPKKVAPRKVAPPAKPVEPIIPDLEVAVPANRVKEEPAVTAPAPIAAPEPVTAAPTLVQPAPVAPYIPLQLLQSPFGKPGMVQTLAIMTLINGILNILYGLTVTSAIVLGTFFIGILCAPVTILPIILGIFEIIYATKLITNPPQPVKPSQTIAILEIIAVISGNLISAIVGILALVFYADTSVKAYFARLNGQA